MDRARLIKALERFAGALPAVVTGASVEDARWKPADGAWSILEIAAHLLDEEVRDFRARLRMILEDPQRPWPAIDPEGWAVSERYNERDLAEVVQRWVAERRESVRWLRALPPDVDWATACQHPKIGAIRSGDLLAAWAAHDALHLRQIAKRMYQLAERKAGEFSVAYAGEWRA